MDDVSSRFSGIILPRSMQAARMTSDSSPSQSERPIPDRSALPNPYIAGFIELGQGYGWTVTSDCGVVKVYAGDRCLLYTGAPSLDELEAAIRGYVFDESRITNPDIPLKAPTGIEPVEGAARPVEPNFADPDAFLDRLDRDFARLQPQIEIYADSLGGR